MSILDPFQPSKRHPWDRFLAAHLANRAGFGSPPAELDRLVHLGVERAVDSLVDFEDRPAGAPPPPMPPWLKLEREQFQRLDDDQRRKLRQESQQEHREALQDLRGWWVGRMQTTARPLEEKLTLFWHGHFATSARVVKNARLVFQQNEMLRRHCIGNFRELLLGISRDPAMLRYLDNHSNRKANPNENYARELLELFTMGAGNYTEQDVKEAARAFTGWTFSPWTSEYVFAQRQHDYGEKVFLGRRGDFDGGDIIRIILGQPVTARFVVRKLFEFFVYENPAAEVVDACAALLREHDYELRPLLRTIFRSELFYSARAVRTQIKSPAQMVIGSARLLGVEQDPKLLAFGMRLLGQELFAPPNVKGWDGGEAWINTNTLSMRHNLARYLVSGEVPGQSGRRGPRGPRVGVLRRLRESPLRNRLGEIVTAEASQDPRQVVDRLVFHLLQARPARETRTWLIDQAAAVPPAERSAVVAHLVMSLPDYQLC